MYNLKKGIAIFALTTLFVSGCSSMKVENELTGEKEFNNASKNAAIGATGGAVVGAFGGVAGAVVGAAIGGAAGGYYGYTLDEAKEKLNAELTELGIEIEDVDGVIYVKLANDLMFDKGSEEVSAEGQNILTRFLNIVKESESKNYLKISGHTDNTGSRDFNISLSENRAKRVAFYLYDNGFPASNIDYTGYADFRPIADNSTEEGRASNRRVTLEIIPSVTKY